MNYIETKMNIISMVLLNEYIYIQCWLYSKLSNLTLIRLNFLNIRRYGIFNSKFKELLNLPSLPRR